MVFDAWFRGGRVAVEESQPAPPGEEGETAAPSPGADGELGALEPSAGTGLHASPIDLRSTRTFAATSADAHDALADARLNLHRWDAIDAAVGAIGPVGRVGSV